MCVHHFVYSLLLGYLQLIELLAEIQSLVNPLLQRNQFFLKLQLFQSIFRFYLQVLIRVAESVLELLSLIESPLLKSLSSF